ncbi:hypothetical protein LOAG_19229 [Loa loa]|nr:hypothetical protein LOAG_19229 [Loa loa]EJD73348.1 hypothetical protein LOAG_19229 [Loa loa]
MKRPTRDIKMKRLTRDIKMKRPTRDIKMKRPTRDIKMKRPTSKQSKGNSPKETKVTSKGNIQSARLIQVRSGSNAKHV